MSDSYREQRPLLCDDYSDEEFDVKNYNYHRRQRPSVCSGRARNYAKGAAAVLTRWPDNCSTSVAYWWLGVSMIAIIIFVIYNSVLIFGMIPTSNIKQPKYRTFNNEIKLKEHALSVPNVYMHLISNDTTDEFLNIYLPYVTVISHKYPDFKYNFLLVLNDTSNDLHDFEDEERNEIAFNSLWVNEKRKKKISSKYNISVEYISLTAYLNGSPINKFWKHLPPHLIEFLIRSISIWEKGGIAFNPKILIPEFSNTNYVNKLYDVFNKYMNKSNNPVDLEMKAKLNVNKKRPNNIQDIIKDLDKEDNNFSNIDLSEAENNDVPVTPNTDKRVKFKRDLKYDCNMELKIDNNSKENNSYHQNNTNRNEKNLLFTNSMNSTHVIDKVLPLFLKYLFDNKPKKEAMRNTSDLIYLEMSKNNVSLFKEHDENGTKIVPKKSNTQTAEESSSLLKMDKYNNIPELSIDIKGNIIASKIACHAFLGTMFGNVVQHTEEETLTDFIISELSLFCNGQLTSCAGINVILV